MRRSYLKLICNIKVPNDTYHCVRLIETQYLETSKLDPAEVLIHNARMMEAEFKAACQFTESQWNNRIWEAQLIERGFG